MPRPRQSSRKMWPSRHTSPNISLPQAPPFERSKNPDGFQNSLQTCLTIQSRIRHGTPLRSTASEAVKLDPPLMTLRDSGTGEDSITVSTPPSSTSEASMIFAPIPGDHTACGGCRSPNIEHISCVSSTTASSSTHTTSPSPRPPLSKKSFGSLKFEEQPPWDRGLEIVWTRHVHARGIIEQDDVTAFRENLKRLRGDTATVNPDPSSPEPPIKEPDDKRRYSHGTEDVKNSQAKDPRKILLLKELQNANSSYFRLPDTIRFMIMKHALAGHNPHSKPIRMNNPVFLWEAWPVNRLRKPKVWTTEYFESLETLLSSVETYTSVCSAMRADALATIFLTRRFHIVYAPFVGTESQPAATKYMDQYGPLMASITLEIDFTKLSGGFRPEAANFHAPRELRRLKTLVEGFVQRQLTRRGGTTIRDLRVLVRRYHGSRPALSESSPASPYTPPTHIAQALSPLKSLGPLVTALTVTGAPEAVTVELIASLSGRWTGEALLYRPSDAVPSSPAAAPTAAATTEVTRGLTTYRVPPVEYPFLPGQRSVVSTMAYNGSGREVEVVGCQGVGEEGWEGLYGCRLVGGRRSGALKVEGLGKKKKLRMRDKGEKGVRRGVLRMAGSVLSLHTTRERGERGRCKSLRKREKKKEEEETDKSSADNPTPRMFSRLASAERKGLFGHY